MKQSWICLSLVAFALMVAAPAVAQPSVPESEVSVRGLLAPNGDVTGLFGGVVLAHRSGPLYLGGGGYGGPIVGQNRGGMGYGGTVLGASSTFAGSAFYDARLLLGGGGGTVAGRGMGSLVLEPSIAVGVVLPGESTISLTAGYLYMPNANELSGATVGLRYLL